MFIPIPRPIRILAALALPLGLAVACQTAPPEAPPGAAAGVDSQPAADAQPAGDPQAQALPAPDLTAVKAYLVGAAATLKTNTAALKAAAERYHALAEGHGLDYAALWQAEPDAVRTVIGEARDAWREASPGYERIEGIVAGVPSLADFDVILDAGSSAEEGGENVVPFDLTLADGRVLDKPGNLFGVTESALWGTFPAFAVPGLEPDLDGDGTAGFGDRLPDALVLLAGAAALDDYTGQLAAAADAWQPTTADAFTALVVMIPTMSEYFDSWKGSRFVAGETSTQRDFVAISRLADIQDILSGLEVVYGGIRPLVAGLGTTEGEAIAADLADLKGFVSEVYTQEQGGKRYSSEEADLLGAEAQNRATAITGRLTQAAAALGVALAE